MTMIGIDPPGRNAVEVRGLGRVFTSKHGPDHVALDGFDLTVGPGEVHGLLGPNGAGKTTLCKILSTVLLPTSGTAKVDGFDVVADARRVRPVVGIVFGGDRGLYARMTAGQNLRFWAALYGLGRREARRRSEALLERVGLAERTDSTVETFSRGMKQRLHLARGLIGDPRVLILDEPTVGMDPVSAHEFRDLVEELRGEGRAILLTTHDMAEAEALCDRVSFIDDGRLLRCEEPRVLGELLSKHERVRASGVADALAERIAGLDGVEALRRNDDGSILVETNRYGAALLVLRTLVEAGVGDVSTAPPTLEEVYLHLIGDRGMAVRS
ncbi:ABC transporter ATP-binding protein [Glycomyces sp. NPDC046736]|uniref:ABC transporter ATP-binding protein n=1 Tax=Glycomyces sp. NPDC046736 TaxID=3155615 RepID=UPI00340DDEC2